MENKETEFEIRNLKEKGYCIIKNLLDENQVIEMKKFLSEKKKNLLNNKEYVETDDERCWHYLTNRKLINLLKRALGDKIFYMHDFGINDEIIIDNKRSWHRDNPCRSTGKGPDWDNEFPYNVLTTITYLSSSRETNSSLNVLPKSQNSKFKFTFTNLMRLLHRKSSNYKFFNLIRSTIKLLIGKKITYEKGDCLIFFSNLYHMGDGITSNGETRKLITARYGGKGKHSENYMNYIFKHREWDRTAQRYIHSIRKSEFFDFLIKNQIFHPIPEKKKEIKGIYSKQRK